jgi:hypothetical protein
VAAFGATDLLGWTPDALELVDRFRGWTEPAIERLELAWLAEERRVGITVRDPVGDVAGELLYDPTGEHHPKMIARAGTPRELFPPPELIGDAELDEHRTVWLLEGEPDAIRAWSLGLVATAVPGAANWREEWAARFTGRHLRVIVCFDCDQAGRAGAARAAASIAAAGVDARLLELDPDRDDGYDLTDWSRGATNETTRAQAAASLQAIAEQLELYRPPGEHGERPWSSVPWSTFRDTAPPAHNWLIDGLLPAGALCFVAGPPKRGKTWIGIAVALAIALGRPYIEFDIPEPRDVLYLALEGSQTGLRTRIGALARGFGTDPDTEQLERLHMLYRPRPFDLAEIATADWLLEEALEVDAALVVVDVLRAAARFQENVAEDFARIRDHLNPLLELERTVMLLHHFGKLTETQKERSPGERMAGTGAMYGALDVGFLITRSTDGARRLRVDIEARDFAAPDALGLAIDGEGTGKHGGFRYDDVASLVIDESAAADRDVAGEVEQLFADGRWRLADEIRKPPRDDGGGGIGVNLELLHDHLDPLCWPPAPGVSTRFVRLAGGRAVGRAATAKPYGTWAMYEALPEPRPDRLERPESVESVPDQGSLLPDPADRLTPTGVSPAESVRGGTDPGTLEEPG